MNRRTFLKRLGYSGGMLVSPLFWLAGCSSEKKKEKTRPRLVLTYATCSVATSHLSPYNGRIGYTPNLGQFGAESAVFTKHQTEAGLSSIAYASIVSGCQADRHGVFENLHQIDDSINLITASFVENGYEVYFWDGHPMASMQMGYARGVPPENRIPSLLSADDSRFGGILERLYSDKQYRAFILTTGTVVHNPYCAHYEDPRNFDPDTLPSEFEVVATTHEEFQEYVSIYFREQLHFKLQYNFRETVRELGLNREEEATFTRVIEYLYKCGVHRSDKLFGDIINKLHLSNLLDESLIVFTSDHGETMNRDNTFFKFCHGHQLTPEVLTVPCIVRAPSLGVKPAKHSFVSRSIDVFPTIAGLCSLHIPEKQEPAGIDLSSSITRQVPPPNLSAYSHTGLVPEIVIKDPGYRTTLLYKLFPRRDPELSWVSVRIGDMVFKLAKSGPDPEEIGPLVFDLAKDPEERVNLFEGTERGHQKIFNELRQYKENLISACRRRYSDMAPGMQEDERLEKLKSLGYI